jgi:hypothetical protein
MQLLADYTSDKDVILAVTGMGSGRNREAMDFFLTRMALDYGEAWKSEYRNHAVQVLANNNREETAHWQFGNEINSQKFSENVHAWTNTGKRGRDHDLTTIPYYVEMYLAPGVEAIRETLQDNGNGALLAEIPIVLGSIAAFANPSAQKFLDALLNYRIEGRFAPSLKGKPVYELVDVISLHYIATSNSPSRRTTLDTVRRNWLGKGTIKSIWSTEELGIQRGRANAGSVFTAQVFARYMDWWLENEMNAQQGRAFFWGSEEGDIGHRGSESMDHLLERLGPSAELERVDQSSYSVNGDNLEYYAFSVKEKSQVLIFVFPHDQKKSAELKQLSIRSLGEKLDYKYIAADGSLISGLNLDKDMSLEKPLSIPATSMLILEISP